MRWKPFRDLYKYLYRKLDILVRIFVPPGNKRRAKKLYAIWSKFYDISVKTDKNYLRGLHETIDMSVSKGDVTLDIGCGTGFATFYAAKTSKKVIGIDLSEAMVNKIQKKIDKKGVKNVEVLTGSFPEDMQSPDNKFDSIISSHTFVHYGKKQRTDAYKAIFDLLKTGGTIGLFTTRGEIAPMFEKRDELIKNLKQSGFKNIETKYFPDVYLIAIAQKPHKPQK